MAKRGIAGAVVLPLDVESVEDLPADLALAIDHGFKIISWQENLMEEEMPPRWMWHLDWELETWFEEVETLRKQKYGGGSDESLEEASMMRNDDPSIKERFGK